MKSPTLDLVIPSYNGVALLAKHLPTVLKNSRNIRRVIVVNDGSNDTTASYLRENFPQVLCLPHQPHLGFTKSVNLGFAEATADLVVLLNNDVSPGKDYLQPVLPHFTAANIFAVTLNEISSSWPLVSWQGKLQYMRGEDKTAAHFSAWASGGSAVFRRSLWNKLGGFDEIYSPGYWEDIDLGWRAWKAGYRIIWEPKAKVEHQHESSFSLFDRGYVDLIKQRNELLFNWKNISDSTLKREHYLYLLQYCLAHPGYTKVIFSALRLLPQIKQTTSIISDTQILALVNQPL